MPSHKKLRPPKSGKLHISKLNRSGFGGGSNLWEDGAMMKKSTKLSPEVLERAVRMVFYARYTERRAEAGVEPSVGSRGYSYDSAPAETINGLYKAEVIHRHGPWKSVHAVEPPRSNESVGSTITDCLSRSVTFHQPRLRQTTIAVSR